MARIIDCSIFHNEFMMLDFRLRALSDAVDRFVLVEADRTFSGLPRQLVLRRWLRRKHPELIDRIDVVEVTDMPANPNPWVREAHQRNAMLRGLGTASRRDLILMFDIDEIPDVGRIEAAISNDDICAVEQRFFYYFFNLSKGLWTKGAASLMRNLTLAPHTARDLPGRPLIEAGGWHFSYVMAPDAIAEKIRAFSHQELNDDAFTDSTQIARRIAARVDLFDRDEEPPLQPCPIDDSFPAYLRRNRRRYARYILDVDTPGDKDEDPREDMSEGKSAPDPEASP